MKKNGFMDTEFVMQFAAIALVVIVVVVGLGRLLLGCSQIKARMLGGTKTIELESNNKLVNCTWKDNNIWILTTDRSTNELPKTYKFSERSLAGVLQGTVVIQEK